MDYNKKTTKHTESLLFFCWKLQLFIEHSRASTFLPTDQNTPFWNTNKGIANQYKGFIVSHKLLTRMNRTIKYVRE